MKYFLLALLILMPSPAFPGGLLEDIQGDVRKIVNDKSLSRDSATLAERAYMKIERAALAQSIQEDALAKKILDLEIKVKKQQDIISRYEAIVAELQSKLQQAPK